MLVLGEICVMNAIKTLTSVNEGDDIPMIDKLSKFEKEAIYI